MRSIRAGSQSCCMAAKTGDDRWYDVNVPIADQLYDEYLSQLRAEGLIQ